MNIIKKIKRLFYKFRNDDPVQKCPVYKDEGCSHVDGMLCNHPNCEIIKKYMGKKWVSCVECQYQDECSSVNFGFGCYDGLEEEYEDLA